VKNRKPYPEQRRVLSALALGPPELFNHGASWDAPLRSHKLWIDWVKL